MKSRLKYLRDYLEIFRRDTDGDYSAEAATLLNEAEKIACDKDLDAAESEFWHEFLYITGKKYFLRSLKSREMHYRWASLAFKIIDRTNYTLLDVLQKRVNEHPNKTFLFEPKGSAPISWNYEYIARHTREIAAAFYRIDPHPRVALFLENCAEGACSDLACLLYDIFVVPLNVHFDLPVLTWIFNRLKLNIVVADTSERLHHLIELQGLVDNPFQIIVTDESIKPLRDDDLILGESCSLLTPNAIERTLAARNRRGPHEVSTIMFTSGSTGMPKGVCFTPFNIVSKRFARAAALPDVGEDEVLLSYLPLFHTFGRYLELLGMLYWGGTYVFAGNPSVDTLLMLLSEVNPTGLVGIPLRWQQIHDSVLHDAGELPSEGQLEIFFRKKVGRRLRWGLAAAGYLEPEVFKFFQSNGVDLCSGFGMTEATGGVTMTPPGEYQDNSVGIPLPGIETSFSDVGELSIAGPYVARYLEEFNDDATEFSFNGLEDKYFLPTGDLFKITKSGHYEIVDRIKDIYKNNRGQTIAPRHVEQLFEGVPGIKRTFLVGDRRDYNVLLIVPEHDDPGIRYPDDDESIHAYFHKIVTSANNRLAPYERIVNIAVLDRDFDKDKRELTPKGSFSRKIIEKNFDHIIRGLYERNFVELYCDEFSVTIPRWIFRDLGILESDIEFTGKKLVNKSAGHTLDIFASDRKGTYRIGDLEYNISGRSIDLGLFARQPQLWAGNPALISFCQCKEGWDTPWDYVAEHVFLPERTGASLTVEENYDLGFIHETRFITVNKLIIRALYYPVKDSLESIEQLAQLLKEVDDRLRTIIRSRLEALARHPKEEVRCKAYFHLLLDEPMLDYSKVFPAFVLSGKSFLNEDIINILSRQKIEKSRLEALRKRMLSYRIHLDWPAGPVVRQQFKYILKLMANYVKNSPEYYGTVRAELAAWIMHKKDPEIAASAKRLLNGLVQWFEKSLEKRYPVYSEKMWLERLVFDEEISDFEIDKLKNVFIGTSFLQQSVMLAFDVESFDLMQVQTDGIWISRILSQRHQHRYLVSVNTIAGNHYDILLSLREDFQEDAVTELLYRLITVSGYPHDYPPVPQFGCCRPELGAMSVVYMNDLTAWERIRDYSGLRVAAFTQPRRNFLRKLFIRAIAAYFAILKNSGYTILPKIISPSNTVVPEPDFRRDAAILTMIGWRQYTNTLSLIKPLIKNFYQKTAAHYPWTRSVMKTEWIFDACVEALGVEKGKAFLDQLKRDLKEENIETNEGNLKEILDVYQANLGISYFVPLPLQNATDRYRDWIQANPQATLQAKEDTVKELFRLYRIDRYNDIARYCLFRNTYFAESSARIRKAFDTLLEKMFQSPSLHATNLMELSDLQSVITGKHDRHVFSQLVFPRMSRIYDLDVLTIGESDSKQVLIRTQISDKDSKTYYVREPIKPTEIGYIYRMFLRQNYPKTISEQDRFYIALDNQDRIIGGVCYRYEHGSVIHLDGIIVSRSLVNKGLGSALLEDFCVRMINQGKKVVKTHYFLKDFYLKRNFKVDKRWGGLVRFLDVVGSFVPDDTAIS